MGGGFISDSEDGPGLPWPALRQWMARLADIAELEERVCSPQGAKGLESGEDRPGREGQGLRGGPYLLPDGPRRGACGCRSARADSAGMARGGESAPLAAGG